MTGKEKALRVLLEAMLTRVTAVAIVHVCKRVRVDGSGSARRTRER